MLITALAIAVRLAWVLKVPTRPVGDFAMYVESARYLVERHALDPEFIYMPGYVLLVALVDALGGGLVAIKMIGVAAGGLTTAAVYGTTRALFGRGAAAAAGLACALWPAGVAVSSVTGTDMPAAALIAVAVWLLVANAPEHPIRAPALYGLAMGLAAYVRAIALPLVALAALHFRARGARWRHAVTRTILAVVVALLTLLPWAVRNDRRYGELFVTDSHGGHTALVGAYPNTDGTYSRSLNRAFAAGTGYRLFGPPHRAADRAAYALARQWTAFEPRYALGLLVAKTDRLLGNERPLLYWPLYRQSVLPDGSAVKSWFDVHRARIEHVTDGFWYALVGAFVVGVIAAAGRRNTPALSLLPLPLALAAVYAAFFAEARYHLAVAALALPFAGEGAAAVVRGARDFFQPRTAPRARRRIAGGAALAAAALALVFVGWPRVVAAGQRLRDRHRWAVAVCDVDGASRLCSFRAAAPADGRSPSPVRGVWDGFGLTLSGPEVAAATRIDLPAGSYRVSARIDGPGPPPDNATVELRAGGVTLALVAWPARATDVTLSGQIVHAGGPLRVQLGASAPAAGRGGAAPTLWVSAFAVEAVGR